jgi:predicted nucleotidyltransferase
LAESEFLQHALSRAQPIVFLGHSVPILTLEDLIVMKEFAGRLQDRVDLEKITQRQAELQIDWNYVHFWKEKLGVLGIE